MMCLWCENNEIPTTETEEKKMDFCMFVDMEQLTTEAS